MTILYYLLNGLDLCIQRVWSACVSFVFCCFCRALWLSSYCVISIFSCFPYIFLDHGTLYARLPWNMQRNSSIANGNAISMLRDCCRLPIWWYTWNTLPGKPTNKNLQIMLYPGHNFLVHSFYAVNGKISFVFVSNLWKKHVSLTCHSIQRFISCSSSPFIVLLCENIFSTPFSRTRKCIVLILNQFLLFFIWFEGFQFYTIDKRYNGHQSKYLLLADKYCAARRTTIYNCHLL